MKKLNKYQKMILLTAIILFLLCTLYPPWKALTNAPDYDVSQAIGYGPLFSPPNSPLGYDSYVVINYSRLFLQWALLAIIAWVSVMSAGKRRTGT